MTVDDEVVQELRDLFDSSLHEQHVRVIAALFGKCVPPTGDLLIKGAKDVMVR